MRAVIDHSPDAVLAVAASEGNQAAFAAIMRRHKGWLYRFICHYVADREEAYDVLQESFVSAWKALARFDPERPLEIWLRRIALNKCRDRARRNAVRRAAFSLLALDTAASNLLPAADLTASADQAVRRLEIAVASLPIKLKESLILTMLEGLSHKEAGALLGINAKAVEMRVYRAKRRLAAQLDPADLKDLTAVG